MNIFPYPYIPNPYINMNNPNIEEEILKLQREIKILKDRVTALENKEKNDYLKKEDGLYML